MTSAEYSRPSSVLERVRDFEEHRPVQRLEGRLLRRHSAQLAIAEAQVREVDVLTEPSIGADLADQIVHRKRLTELQLVRLEEAVAGAECFVGVAPAIERLKFAVRSETE